MAGWLAYELVQARRPGDVREFSAAAFGEVAGSGGDTRDGIEPPPAAINGELQGSPPDRIRAGHSMNGEEWKPAATGLVQG